MYILKKMESEVKYGDKTMTNSISHGKQIRYMVVWIQNHDKFVVLIWKTLDMRFGCKITINSLHSVQYSNTKNIGSIKFPI
jgi:hypothetical protein